MPPTAALECSHYPRAAPAQPSSCNSRCYGNGVPLAATVLEQFQRGGQELLRCRGPWALLNCSLLSSFICHPRALIRPVLSQALAWWAWPSSRRLYRGHGLKVDDLHGALGLAKLLKVQALGLAESSSLTSTCLYSQSHKVNEKERVRAWNLERQKGGWRWNLLQTYLAQSENIILSLVQTETLVRKGSPKCNLL